MQRESCKDYRRGETLYQGIYEVSQNNDFFYKSVSKLQPETPRRETEPWIKRVASLTRKHTLLTNFKMATHL
jgi:hypothetical protein